MQLWRTRGGQTSASPSLACRRPRADHSKLPSKTDPQQTDASAARLVAMMEKQTTALLNGLTGMLQQLLERQAQPLGAPADLHTPSPRQSPPGTAPTAPQATALPPPPAAALTLPPPPPTSSWGPPDPHRAPARHRRGETPQGRNSTGGKQHTGKPTRQHSSLRLIRSLACGLACLHTRPDLAHATLGAAGRAALPFSHWAGHLLAVAATLGLTRAAPVAAASTSSS